MRTVASWSCPKAGRTLGLQHADDLAAHPVDAQGLAERVAVAEQLLAHGLADDADIAAGAALGFAKGTAFGHIPVAGEG